MIDFADVRPGDRIFNRTSVQRIKYTITEIDARNLKVWVETPIDKLPQFFQFDGKVHDPDEFIIEREGPPPELMEMFL
jgi:hypothetical protein